MLFQYLMCYSHLASVRVYHGRKIRCRYSAIASLFKWNEWYHDYPERNEPDIFRQATADMFDIGFIRYIEYESVKYHLVQQKGVLNLLLAG
jgi:hypothetical protein